MRPELLGGGGFKHWWRTKYPIYRFRPHTGRLALDFFYLVVLYLIEEVLLGALPWHLLSFDLITPWLVVSVLQKRPAAATMIALVAASIQETRSSIPAGTFVCAYLILTVAIVQVRAHLSWRYSTPWLVMFVCSWLFVQIFTVFVTLILSGIRGFDGELLLDALRQCILVVAFGFFLCRPWLATHAEEPVPQ